ncbi:MAG: 7-cyano-7-deazaguanine synthase QueC [Planctomycetes bacterium]|nr:7-cyano-7-deazaguanine synthase QueC [Planctomycetota bacterium]
MRKKAVLLLSGGLDSTVASFVAAADHEPVVALGFDYGQKARRRELAAGYALARQLGCEHRTIFLPFFREFAQGALTENSQALPEPATADLDDPEKGKASAAAVWVPNRNGIFIAIGAAWAERLQADVLVVGFNAEEARTFPDNSADFVRSQNEALEWSTANGVQVLAPTIDWTKRDIVARAMAMDLPLELVWSCYEGEDEPCGRCESCKRFDRAVGAAEAEAWLAARRKRMKSR